MYSLSANLPCIPLRLGLGYVGGRARRVSVRLEPSPSGGRSGYALLERSAGIEGAESGEAHGG